VSAPRLPMLALEEVDPILATPASYVDYSVSNSLLSGILIAVLAGWAMVMFNRLWQATLRQDAADALAHAQARGLTIHPDGLRARVVAEGSVGSERIRIEWCGGWRGPHVTMLRGDRFVRMPFIESAAALDAVLEPQPSAG
jgi:hypothetical protein